MKRWHELVARGLIGGILAGSVVALWFLLVDALAGHPFHTPAALARTLSHHAAAVPMARLVAVYTVVHFGVFAALGIVAAWVLDALELRPALLWGVIFGIVVQEFVFYAGLFIGGAPPSQIVPWRHVVGANLLSGIVLMAYLHRAIRATDPLGLAVLGRYPVLFHGVLTGLIGAAVVAVWFFVLDVIGGQPFRTAGALGSALLLGATSPADVSVNLGIVAAYTVCHVVAFVAAGTVFVAVAEGIERAPRFLLLAMMAAIVLQAAAFAMVALDAQWVMGTVGVASIFFANILAVACMGWYVWQTHPVLRHRLRDEAISVVV